MRAHGQFVRTPPGSGRQPETHGAVLGTGHQAAEAAEEFAPHAVLIGAGGRVEQPDGSPLVYGKDDILNPNFVAYGWK